jgi:hypothetical protein
MATTVVINSNPATIVSLKPASKSFASVSVAPSSNISLGSLTDVNVSGAENNEVLIFDQANNKFVVSPITLDANTIITNINGGLF